MSGWPGRTAAWLRGHWRESAVSLLVFVVLVAGLQLILPAAGVKSYVLPTPWEVARAFGTDISSDIFWKDTWATFYEVVLGCLTGSAAGFLLALLVNSSTFLKAVLTPYVVVIQAIPKVAVAPIIVVGLGYGVTSKVFIAATISFFPVFINGESGLANADPDQLELMRALRATKWQTLRWVQIPSATATILAGVEMAFVFSVVGAIVGEFAGASEGLGYLISQRSFNLDQAGVFSALIVLSAMAMLLDGIVRLVARYFSRWQRAGHAPLAQAPGLALAPGGSAPAGQPAAPDQALGAMFAPTDG